jgi:RimJ/RimL family protein N-acetyltransferase
MYSVLETERLRLRPWREADLDAFAIFCADEKSREFLGGTLTRADAWRRKH